MFNWNEVSWNALRSRLDRLPHAVLLQGPEGVGKLALAERLAARLLCETPTEASDACGRCPGCRWVAAGSHPDLRRVEPEALSDPGTGADSEGEARDARRPRQPSSEIRIDQIRELSDFLYLGSHRGGQRVAIVHPAESMNVHAANALLKGLEEPPLGARFLLVCHHPARLLPTIRSRCVVVSVPRPTHAAALGWLHSVVPEPAQASRWLAFAGGSPRLAHAYSSGERGAHIAPYLEAVARGAPEDLQEATDRASLEALAEVLQKHAIDRVAHALGGRSIYGTLGQDQANAKKVDTLAWARLARELGRARALARHPVNPRLFSAELKYEVSKFM
ncbi:MAG: DNA polymerase III subunit delta' [Burkholderiales bacterium]|nr:DNA polymerase III subunit delta' [Burkholderiales bacterium]